MPRKMLDLRTVEVAPVSISKILHNAALEDLMVYDTVRRWLELQPEKVMEGCNPVRILKQMVEQAARMTVAGTNGMRNDAIEKIGSLLR